MIGVYCRQSNEQEVKVMRERMKQFGKTVWEFLVNPRLLLCFLLAWLITNGWSYIMLAVGTYFGIGWMITVAGAYIAILWFPFSPEKIVTVAITILLLRLLFPGDTRTLGKLKALRAKICEKKKK